MEEADLEKRLEGLIQQEQHIEGTVEHIYNKLEQLTTALLLTQFRFDRIELNSRVTVQYLLERIIKLEKLLRQSQEGGSQEEGSQGGGTLATQQVMKAEPKQEIKNDFKIPSKEQSLSNILGMRNRSQNPQTAYQPTSLSSGQQQKR